MAITEKRARIEMRIKPRRVLDVGTMMPGPLIQGVAAAIEVAPELPKRLGCRALNDLKGSPFDLLQSA